LLRRLPEAANDELLSVLRRAGPVLLGRMRARLPERTHALDAALAFKVYRSLRLRVGLLSKRQVSRFFYFRILDIGRRAQKVRVRRRPRNSGFASKTMANRAGGRISSYVMNVKGFRGRFVRSKGREDFDRDFLPDYRKVMDRALARAARGVGND